MESNRFAGMTPSEGHVCTPCRVVPPPFVQAVAHGVYEEALREMIHLLKYEGVESLAKPLGALLAGAVLTLDESGLGSGEVLVVAVPLFPANVRQRGYNQSILLADEAVARLKRLRPGWKIATAHKVLRRVKATASQFSLSTRGRRRNLVGAFKVQDENSLLDRDVLLIDDIYTTGATARACAKVLVRAGARRVWVATLARAQRERVALWGSSGHRLDKDDFG